jgi:hypothetical protein
MTLTPPTSSADAEAKAGINLYVALKVLSWLVVPCIIAGVVWSLYVWLR